MKRIQSKLLVILALSIPGAFSLQGMQGQGDSGYLDLLGNPHAFGALSLQQKNALDYKKHTQRKEEKKLKKQYYVVQPIAHCAGSPLEKIALLNQVIQQRNTKAVYVMMHDADITTHVQDAKNAQELNVHALVDAQGKTVLEHAIENNDARFVAAQAKKLSVEQRQTALRYAADKERPRVLLALLPMQAGESDEKALERYFFGIQDLKISEYTTYQETLKLVKQYRKDRAALICSKIVSKLPFDAQASIAHMLHPTVRITDIDSSESCMHVAIEQEQDANGIKPIDSLLPLNQAQDDALRQACAAGRTGDFMQALARGANPNVLSVLGDPIAFTALLQANTVFLTMLLESKSFNLKATVNDDQGRAHPLLLWAIAKNKPDHAKLLLDAGCDPNALNGFGDPIARVALFQDNTVFLKMLLESKSFNLKTTVNDTEGRAHPLLLWAILNNKPDHAKLLLDAGCDPNALDGLGNPIAWRALCQDNTVFLKMLLESKSFNLKTTMNDDQGRAHPLLLWAILNNKPDHAKLLLDAGCDPNALDGLGNPIAWAALCQANTVFLKMLIDKGLNFSVKIMHRGKMVSLADLARMFGKQMHLEMIEQAIVKQAARAKQAEEDYIYSCA